MFSAQFGCIVLTMAMVLHHWTMKLRQLCRHKPIMKDLRLQKCPFPVEFGCVLRV